MTVPYSSCPSALTPRGTTQTSAAKKSAKSERVEKRREAGRLEETMLGEVVDGVSRLAEEMKGRAENDSSWSRCAVKDSWKLHRHFLLRPRTFLPAHAPT